MMFFVFSKIVLLNSFQKHESKIFDFILIRISSLFFCKNNFFFSKIYVKMTKKNIFIHNKSFFKKKKIYMKMNSCTNFELFKAFKPNISFKKSQTDLLIYSSNNLVG